eukprot:TRINITY_DN50018_c0_g1_i2.p1 TRINITY_DN50018_c0_g1~~TRINITY_DN50018_c0_g1_i2.p1  ORF type:complete len:179 (+),score=21.94 TRINITY_DN50018_c0_g1_i2:183-719(+)
MAPVYRPSAAMSKILALAVILALATGVFADSYVSLSANLYGKYEIPKNSTDVAKNAVNDPNGRGKMLLHIYKVNGAFKYVQFAVSVKNMTGEMPPTKTHIHMGKKGVNGDLLVNLPCEYKNIKGSYYQCKGFLGKKSSEQTANLTAALKGIAMNPKGYYGNIHTKRYPDGALRGQLKG